VVFLAQIIERKECPGTMIKSHASSSSDILPAPGGEFHFSLAFKHFYYISGVLTV
jgi:hypothetical protein